MRLMCLPSHFDADGYLRMLLPARELRRQGWQVEVVPHITQRIGPAKTVAHYGIFEKAGDSKVKLVESAVDWLARQEFDVLMLQQREEPDWPQAIAALQAQGKRVVVDSDDAWFGLPDWNPGSKKTPEAVAAMVAQVSAADLLTVATPALAEMYAPYQRNIAVIRNRLDWGIWADVAPRSWKRLRVGWMGQSQWRAGDLDVLRGVIGPWLQEHPEVEFVAAGDPLVHDLIGVPQAQRVSTNQVAFANMDLADITAVMDVGLVPLDLGKTARSLNECKSHLKGAEYNACGIPFIASPSESYRYWTREGDNGLLAASPAQWRNCLDAMLDPGLREHMGRYGRDLAKAEALHNHPREWREILERDRDHADPDRARAAAS